jgi:Xaa-Pro dipeptidase
LSNPEARGPAGSLAARRTRAAAWLAERDLDVTVLAEFEGLRNASLRYLTGHPMDALLLLFRSGKALLVPWDVPMAERCAQVEEIQPYGRFDRSIFRALKELLTERGIRRAELSGTFPFPLVRELGQALPRTELLCRREGIDEALAGHRAVKDPAELEALRAACHLTNELIEAVETFLGERDEASETELALHLEALARSGGAEGMAFETLAAGPERSFAIHAFPPYTAGRFGAPGPSILDFGVCCGGADPEQIGARIDRFLADRGYRMPHGLGHGIGLEAHEAPMLRPPRSSGLQSRGSNALRAGMVLAIEPGAYQPQAGGVRLENDVLVTERGAELLTAARLLRMGG